MNLGNKIIELRKKNNLTQEDLASKLNVSRQAISKYENNLSEPDIQTIKKLCEIFNISYNELLGYEDNNDKKESKNKIYTIIKLVSLIVFTSICLGLLALPIIRLTINYSIYPFTGTSTFQISFYSMLVGRITDKSVTLNLNSSTIPYFYTLILYFVCLICTLCLALFDLILFLCNKRNDKFILFENIFVISTISSIVVSLILVLSTIKKEQWSYGIFMLLLFSILSTVIYFVFSTDNKKIKSKKILTPYQLSFTKCDRYIFLSTFIVNLIMLLSSGLYSTGLVTVSYEYLSVSSNYFSLINQNNPFTTTYSILMYIFLFSQIVLILYSIIVFVLKIKNFKKYRLILYCVEYVSLLILISAIITISIGVNTQTNLSYNNEFEAIYTLLISLLFILDTLINVIFAFLIKRREKNSLIKE